MTWRDQPRWPSGTPGGGHRPGPGPGRWRDGDAPGSGTGSGGGGWLRRLSDLISRRGRRGRDSSLRPWETDAEDARRQQDIRRRYGLPEDASPEETGEAIRYFATRGQAGSPGRSTRRLDGDPLSNPVMRMADGSTPAGDYTAAGDDYDERLLAWEDEATRYMRDQHNFSQERIDRFWENVALGGGAGPDDNPNPREWVDQEIADGILDDDPDLEFNDDDQSGSSAYRPRTLPDGSADPDNQLAWEDEVKQLLDDRGYDPDQAEVEFEGFGSEYFDWHDDPAGFVDYVIEEIGDPPAAASTTVGLSTQPSASELETIGHLSNMAGPGGWVDAAAFRGLFRPNDLDSLVRKGWVERSGDRYRVDPRGMEGRSGPTESGALVGDVYPADPLVRRVDTGGPETIEGDWADRVDRAIGGSGQPGFDQLPDVSHRYGAGARAVSAGRLTDLDLPEGEFEVYNPDEGEWEELLSYGVGGRGGVDAMEVSTPSGGFNAQLAYDDDEFGSGEDDDIIIRRRRRRS